LQRRPQQLDFGIGLAQSAGKPLAFFVVLLSPWLDLSVHSFSNARGAASRYWSLGAAIDIAALTSDAAAFCNVLDI